MGAASGTSSSMEMINDILLLDDTAECFRFTTQLRHKGDGKVENEADIWPLVLTLLDGG